MELRDYQTAAVNSVYSFLRERATNPCVVLPTAAGKTPVIATLCRDAVNVWNGRVLILAHVKELLQQSADKLQLICPTIKVGIYSAGLKRRDTTQSVIIAGIQSVHDKADQLGSFDIVIVDEAHLIGEEGMYRKLIADLQEINPDLRIIGLTATPYRLSSGAICTPEGILNEVCYEVSVKVLMNRGYLSKMISKAATNHIDSSALKIVRGEFDPAQTETAFDSVVVQATEEILEKTQDRKSVLIFSQNIAHARQVAGIIRGVRKGLQSRAAEQLQPAKDAGFQSEDLFEQSVAADWLDDRGLPSEAVRYSLADAFGIAEVYGDTPADDRARILADFKAGDLKYLVNVNVLTTGFDAPNIDAIALMRATVSPGLYYQMVGRGFRIHPDKEVSGCLVLDFGENVKRHGPVDCIRMRKEKKDKDDAGKECPECHSVMARNASACLDCGHVWEVAERKPTTHAGRSSNEDIVSGDPKTDARDVMSVTYKVHTKKNAVEGAPKTLRVSYQLSISEYQSEWVCIEHASGSFAHRKAEDWWERRCYLPMPDTAAEACAIASQGWLAPTESIAVKTDPKKDFPEIVRHTVGDIPRTIPPCPKCSEHTRQVILPNDEPRYPGRIVCGVCSHLVRYASADDIAVFGILDPANQKWDGEIHYELEAQNLPEEKTEWDEYETPENPF